MATLWEEFIGTDWGTDTSQSTVQGALNQYVQHLTDMQDKKNWPRGMVHSLIQKASVAANYANTPTEFWNAIADKEVGWMAESNVMAGSLPKYDSHIAFLRAVGASTESLERAKAEYSPLNVFAEVTKKSAKDAKDAADPKKSPWPWIAGGVVLLLLLKR